MQTVRPHNRVMTAIWKRELQLLSASVPIWRGISYLQLNHNVFLLCVFTHLKTQLTWAELLNTLSVASVVTQWQKYWGKIDLKAGLVLCSLSFETTRRHWGSQNKTNDRCIPVNMTDSYQPHVMSFSFTYFIIFWTADANSFTFCYCVTYWLN